MKALWLAIAFLGLCVPAIGGTLIRQQPGAAASIVPLTGAQAMLAPQTLAPLNADPKVSHPMPANASSASAAKKVAAAPSSGPAAPMGAVANAPSCTNCGTVEAVTPITRQGQASGAGMVGGAVLGGVLGNQVGKGNGRTAATVLGAVGGGWAGNTIEKNMKKTTVYSVRVRMQDGSSRVIEQSAAPTVGSKVIVDAGVLRPA
ncbi:MAG: glycine zipper 2TM domain-containing protein [Brachymonas sp.]